MNDQWTNQLSDYLDDELDAGQRAALEAHLVTCAECRVTLDELRQVVARAKTLEDRLPATDLWSGIKPRLTPGRRPGVNTARRWSFTIPQLLAASIALVLLSGGGVWLALNSRQSGDSAALPVASPSAPRAYNAGRWKVQTDLAVTELEEALARNEGQLDTATVRIVRQNLAIIDRAIAQAQRALRRDPGNAYLNLHLANTMRQKIELLRRANALVSGES